MPEHWTWGGWCNRTDGGDGGDDLTKLELVKNGGLAGGIETDHENSHFLLVEDEQLLEHVLKFGGCETHLGGVGSQGDFG